MRKSFTVIFAIIIFAGTGYSQDVKYFDSPFGGGGGYVPGWFIPNMDPLNKELKNFGVPDLSSSGFYTSGGAGFIYLGFLPGLRVGGMGFSGSTSEEAISGGFNREIVYSIGGGGLTFEYSLPFIKDVGISIGAIVGGGGLNIEFFRNSGSFNWNDVWAEAESDSSFNLSRTLNNSFWFLAPTINIEYPVYRFIAVRLGAGYQLTFGDSWTIENDRPLTGVPSDVKGNGFFIQSGIFIGFFSF